MILETQTHFIFYSVLVNVKQHDVVKGDFEYYKTVPIDSHIPLFCLQLSELPIFQLAAG